MQNLTFFSQAQNQFSLREDIAYLNHAAVSPWPRCAKQTLDNFSAENIFQGATDYPSWLKTEHSLRNKLAELININSTNEIALAKNTSEALSIIAYGLDWQAGDEVVITNHEFPSNRIVWESLAQYGVRLRVADLNQAEPEKQVCNLINAKTKLVSVSSVQYASGITLNLNQISLACQTDNVLFCVDAIQSLGAIPFSQAEVNADFIVADGHKWMMGAEGLALLYVKQSKQDLLSLKQYGWHMIKERGNYGSETWSAASDATRFECGSPNMLGIHVLNSSLQLLLSIGIEQIHQALVERVIYLENALLSIPGIHFISSLTTEDNKLTRSGIITFSVENTDCSALHQKLMQKGIICANRGGGIRLSPHFYTSQPSLDLAVNTIEMLT